MVDETLRVCRQGSRLAHVDALSRSSDEPSKDVEVAGFLFVVDDDVNNWVLTIQMQDTRINHIMAVFAGKYTSPEENRLKADYEICNHRLYRKVGTELRFVVPKPVRCRIGKY